MISNRKKFLILTGLIILIAGFSYLFLTGLWTDPTPPEVRAGWYLPQQDIHWIIPGNRTVQSSSEHLILTGWRDGPALQFPDLSPYCRYENYTRQQTDNKYMIAVWYFKEDQQFLTSKNRLEDFLVNSGNLTTVELIYSGSLTPENRSYGTIQTSHENTWLPARLTTTGYESVNTTGLFFTIEIPGGRESGEKQSAGNNEHYIVYYGTAEPADLASQIPFLKELIGKTYAYDRVFSAGPLGVRNE